MDNDRLCITDLSFEACHPSLIGGIWCCTDSKIGDDETDLDQIVFLTVLSSTR